MRSPSCSLATPQTLNSNNRMQLAHQNTLEVGSEWHPESFLEYSTESSLRLGTSRSHTTLPKTLLEESNNVSSSNSCFTRGGSSSPKSERSLSSDTGPPSGLRTKDLGQPNSGLSSASSSLHAYGVPIITSDSATSSWCCAYPICSSRATFTRGCDLRKHYNRHFKHLYCRFDGCPRSKDVAAVIAEKFDSTLATTTGFSSQKDLERHEAQHNPSIRCTWKGRNEQRCGRVFSRLDNMKDHISRIHRSKKGRTKKQ